MKWIKSQNQTIYNCDYIKFFYIISLEDTHFIRASTNDENDILRTVYVYQCTNQHECSVIFDRLCEFLNDGRRKFLNLKF